MAKNYVRIDKFSSTGHIESVLTKTAPLVAGQFVDLGKVVETGGEAVDYTAAQEGKGFDALIAPVFVDKGYPDFDITKESVPVGKAARALILQKGSIISFNAENVTGNPNAGDNVAIGTGGKGLRKASGSDVVVGKLIAKEFMRNVGELYVVRFT